jgi:hypothetical protein
MAIVAATATACSSDKPATGATTQPSAAPSSSVTTASGSAGCYGPAVAIDSPPNGTKVADGDNGITIHGRACLRTGESVYIFDSSGSDASTGPYTEDSRQDDTDGPIISGSGTFRYRDQPIGDAHVVDEPTVVTFVAADARCRRLLASIDPDNVPGFPLGCQVVATLMVRVTNP